MECDWNPKSWQGFKCFVFVLHYYTTTQLFDDPVFYRKEAEVLSSELRQICKLFVGVCREARAG